jgi:biopolymer transport protein ExbB
MRVGSKAFFMIVALAATGAAAAAEPSAVQSDVISSLLSVPNKLLEGGWTVAIQLALSVVAGAYAIERFVRLRRERIVPPGLAEDAERLWAEGKHREIVDLCDRTPSTLGRIISFIVKHRGNTLTDLSRAVSDIAGRDIRRHISRAYPLAVIGMIEPLLGLLGTVIGMMETFGAVSTAGALGDASLLAGGISKFLVCTGTGLFIAVPCLLLYHYYKLRCTALSFTLEEQVDSLLHSWFLKQESLLEVAAR